MKRVPLSILIVLVTAMGVWYGYLLGGVTERAQAQEASAFLATMPTPISTVSPSSIAIPTATPTISPSSIAIPKSMTPSPLVPTATPSPFTFTNHGTTDMTAKFTTVNAQGTPVWVFLQVFQPGESVTILPGSPDLAPYVTPLPSPKK